MCREKLNSRGVRVSVWMLWVWVLFLAVACAKAELPEPVEHPLPLTGNEPQSVPMTFSASWDADDASRAYVDAAHIYWETGDAVAIYDNLRPTKHIFTVSCNELDPRYASMSGEVTEGSSRWYGVYPAAAAATLSDGACSLTLPHVQRMGSRHVDPTALVSITTGTTMGLAFHNVYALLSFKLDKSDIKHIQLIGNKGSVLAGTATIDPATGKISAIKDPKTEIHLYPSGTYFATNTEYFVPIFPYDSEVDETTYLDGFTLIMYTGSETTSGTSCYIKRTDNTLSLARNKGQRLGTITAGTGYAPSSLEDALVATGNYSTSSSVCFSFNNSGEAYRYAIYSNADCTDLVVAHNLSEDWLTNKFTSGSPRFLVVGGLEQNHTYYYRGINLATGRPTVIKSATTDAFTVKTMARTAAVGDVVLAEDFSELCYHGAVNNTDVYGASPYRGNSGEVAAFAPFKGEIREGTQAAGPVFYEGHDEEARMFCFYRQAIASSRLADWAEYCEAQSATGSSSNTSPVCARNGMLKIGVGSIRGGIVTPPLDFIPAGKKAEIDVTINARLNCAPKVGHKKKGL